MTSVYSTALRSTATLYSAHVRSTILQPSQTICRCGSVSTLRLYIIFSFLQDQSIYCPICIHGTDIRTQPTLGKVEPYKHLNFLEPFLPSIIVGIYSGNSVITTDSSHTRLYKSITSHDISCHIYTPHTPCIVLDSIHHATHYSDIKEPIPRDHGYLLLCDVDNWL